MTAERPRLKRSEEQLREVVRMLCHLVWNGKPAAGEHVWSIPADNERDFDLVLSDAISELVELRREKDHLEAQIAELRLQNAAAFLRGYQGPDHD